MKGICMKNEGCVVGCLFDIQLEGWWRRVSQSFIFLDDGFGWILIGSLNIKGGLLCHLFYFEICFNSGDTHFTRGDRLGSVSIRLGILFLFSSHGWGHWFCEVGLNSVQTLLVQHLFPSYKYKTLPYIGH